MHERTYSIGLIQTVASKQKTRTSTPKAASTTRFYGYKLLKALL
jgi:hypothetical protein